MQRLLILLVFLSGAAPAAAPVPCRVQAISSPHELGRVVAVQVRAPCPPGGYARVRLASGIGGSQPDAPPGWYTLRPGEVLTRVLLPWWWVEWLANSNRPYRVPEVPQ